MKALVVVRLTVGPEVGKLIDYTLCGLSAKIVTCQTANTKDGHHHSPSTHLPGSNPSILPLAHYRHSYIYSKYQWHHRNLKGQCFDFYFLVPESLKCLSLCRGTGHDLLIYTSHRLRMSLGILDIHMVPGLIPQLSWLVHLDLVKTL